MPDPLLVTTVEHEATWTAVAGTVPQLVRVAVPALMLIVRALLLSPPLDPWLMVVDPVIETWPASGLLSVKLIVEGVTLPEVILANRGPPSVFAIILILPLFCALRRSPSRVAKTLVLTTATMNTDRTTGGSLGGANRISNRRTVRSCFVGREIG